jgi:hypothetical protein
VVSAWKSTGISASVRLAGPKGARRVICASFVEQKLNIFPECEVFGTADAVIVMPGLLKIIDLKFGQGLVVEAEENSQLRMYAWGGLQSLDWLSPDPIERIEMTIKQPRRGHEVTKTFTADELRAWAKEVEPNVRKAYRGTGTGNPGDHCRWCKVRATCAERAQAALAVAGMDFGGLTDPEVACTDLEGMTEEQMVAAFKKAPQVIQWFKDIESHLASEAHERKVTGLKWVQGRATRTINKVAEAIMRLRGAGIEPLTEPALLGITELEKRLKAKGAKLNEVIPDCIEVKHGQPVLVPEEDKRPEYSPSNGAVEDFA